MKSQGRKIKKDIKRLRRIIRKLADEKNHYKELYEDLDRYVERNYER